MKSHLSNHASRGPLLALWMVAALSGRATADGPEHQTRANVMTELTFTAARDYADPFNEVTLDAVFTDPKGLKLRVPAFWAGGAVWKVRYASPVLGEHRFRTESSDAKDAGLHGVTGQVVVKPYTGTNPLYVHGPLRVAASKRYLEHIDGKPFFWLGDTWWMGLSKRLKWPDDVKTLAADRKEKGFNVIQIVAGLMPDSHPFDPRSENEGGYAWEAEFHRIRPEFFNAADERLMFLVDQGFTPCIVGAWGYYIRWLGVEKAKQHWRYLIARYGALPVVWFAAGEANLSWYLADGFPYEDREQVAQWTQVTHYIHETDPFGRLVTVHPTAMVRLSARRATEDVSLLDFDILQTPHGEHEAVPLTVQTMRESYADMPVMPVINSEPAYEGLVGRIPAKWARRMFWLCMMNGAAGHTYGANGIWQVNRPGDPHGPSPHMPPGPGYGATPWQEAMNLPGSTHVSVGKKILEQYPWHEFRPHPQWAEFRIDGAVASFEGANWIWFGEGTPAQDAPAEKRFFRRVFDLPQDKHIRSARVRIAADDRFAAYLNGKMVGSGSGWDTGVQFTDIATLLKPGKNVLAIEAENLPAPHANPAGLVVRLEIQFTDGGEFNVITDTHWRSSPQQAAGWHEPGLDDSSWSNAIVAAPYGNGPWGRHQQQSLTGVYGPQSTGIPGELRVIYVPEPIGVTVRMLDPQVTYTAAYIDPISGQRQQLPAFRADAQGQWNCPPPAGCDADWVLTVETNTLGPGK